MLISAGNIPSLSYSTWPFCVAVNRPSYHIALRKEMLQELVNATCKSTKQAAMVATNLKQNGKSEMREPIQRIKWIEISHNITEEQKESISKLPFRMTKRCKALMRQIICFTPEKGSLEDLLAAWVRIMKPRRADWLAVLKELKQMEHPLYLEVAELALHEESFETNIRDYTKIIHCYGKQNHLEEAENALASMKERGFICDQVTLTTMIHMYSKAGNLKMAEATFEEIKLLGEPIDKRSYGSLIMAYVRAGMMDKAEDLLREIDVLQIYAGSEVYKALLRTYSMLGDTKGAQRVFDAIQLAGISPDARLCGLLINAYVVAGESLKAQLSFENMRRAGLAPSDKCIALLLCAFEKENKLNKALDFLMDLERDGIMVGKEASAVLARWFRRLGVVEEVELVLREYAAKEAEGLRKESGKLKVCKNKGTKLKVSSNLRGCL